MAQSVRFHNAINFLNLRKRAYQLAFGIQFKTWFKGSAYRIVFGGPAGQQVLIDLAKFCRADETCVVAERGKPVDRERSLVLEGRREVFLRITQHMYLTNDQLHALYAGHSFKQENGNG